MLNAPSLEVGQELHVRTDPSPPPTIDANICLGTHHHRLGKDQSAGSIVFYANPLIRGFLWSVPDTIASKHVLLALKKQPFRRYKGSDGALVRTVERLRNAAEGSAWQTAALQQTPTHLWDHENELTAY